MCKGILWKITSSIKGERFRPKKDGNYPECWVVQENWEKRARRSKDEKINICFGAGVYLLFVALSMAYAAEGSSSPYFGSKGFERMKELAGAWEGTSNMPKEGEKVRVEYRLSSGGSSVIETLFQGQLTRWFRFIMIIRAN